MKLILGIDATSVRAGGGVTYMVELLNNVNLEDTNFSKVIIWGCTKTLNKISNRNWLIKITNNSLNGNLFRRTFWQISMLYKNYKKENCDVLFVPGGSFMTRVKPIVTLSQNMLPFEINERRRYGFSLMSIKLLILRIIQERSFKNSNGIIFLTNYAKDTISNLINLNDSDNYTVIPHGINKALFKKKNISNLKLNFSENTPMKIIYISIIDMYKHQWNVAEAISILRKEGLSVQIRFIGSSYNKALKIFLNKIEELNDTCIEYVGFVEYDKLSDWINDSDIFLFASTCENLPNILIEGMASGLPIASSNYGPMPEILNKCGLYFNPESIESIVDTIRTYYFSNELRYEKSNLAFMESEKYSWVNTSKKTFDFLNKIAQKHKNQ